MLSVLRPLCCRGGQGPGGRREGAAAQPGRHQDPGHPPQAHEPQAPPPVSTAGVVVRSELCSQSVSSCRRWAPESAVSAPSAVSSTRTSFPPIARTGGLLSQGVRAPGPVAASVERLRHKVLEARRVLSGVDHRKVLKEKNQLYKMLRLAMKL